MSSGNPYQSPDASNFLGNDPDLIGRVVGPAVGLMVAGAINVLGAGYFLLNGSMILTGAVDIREHMDDAAFQDLEADQAQLVDIWIDMQGPIWTVIGIVALLTAILMIVGGWRMKTLRSRGLAMFSSIMAMVPCISSCCLVGLPIGIWAILVLSDAKVRQAFEANANASTFSV